MSDTLAGRVIFDDLEIGEIAIELDDQEPQAVIEWALEALGDGVAVVTALQADGMAILDMAYRLKPDLKVLTVDTLRLPLDTYEFIDQVRRHYHQADFEVLQPDQGEVIELERRDGRDGFLQSVPLRMACCQARKVRPLVNALKDLDGWVTGLRREQWASRAAIRKVELDHDHDGIVKINPLADWTKDEVSAYVEDHGVPVHPLYASGYTSIGCDPCTRPVVSGEDERAGRWWWEVNAPKECGIHCPIETGGFEHEVHAILTDSHQPQRSVTAG